MQSWSWSSARIGNQEAALSASDTIRVDHEVKQRLDALAAARGMEPEELVAELVMQAESAQMVDEVNRELERLSQGPIERRRQQARMRQLEATVSSWMEE
jgi:predicted transcriptional regulator